MLLSQAHTLANQAIEELVACELPESLITPMKELLDDIEKAKCHTKASAYISTLAEKRTLLGAHRPLLGRLDDFDVGDNLQLYDTTPKMEFIPCKPSFFDIALNHVGQIPDLKASLEAYNQRTKSGSGGIFSWLRRS